MPLRRDMLGPFLAGMVRSRPAGGTLQSPQKCGTVLAVTLISLLQTYNLADGWGEKASRDSKSGYFA